jgi:hypothetical protein
MHDTPNTPFEGPEGKNDRAFSQKIRSYFQWDPLPEGHPIEVDHSTRGMGPTAYVNWKRVNLSLKNQYGSALGPLYNALSYEMRGSVGNALLKFPEMQPRSNMTGAEITKFIKEDPDYEWVKKIPDQTLTKYLDKFFSVGADPDPFLSMRLRPKLPQILEDGSVNYMATAHSGFAEQWLDALRDLRRSGWDDSTTDLRQAYITALEPCPTLHQTAQSYNTDSHDLLISHMRWWTQMKTANQVAERKHKEHIKQSMQAQGVLGWLHQLPAQGTKRAKKPM